MPKPTWTQSPDSMPGGLSVLTVNVLADDPFQSFPMTVEKPTPAPGDDRKHDVGTHQASSTTISSPFCATRIGSKVEPDESDRWMQFANDDIALDMDTALKLVHELTDEVRSAFSSDERSIASRPDRNPPPPVRSR